MGKLKSYTPVGLPSMMKVVSLRHITVLRTSCTTRTTLEAGGLLEAGTGYVVYISQGGEAENL